MESRARIVSRNIVYGTVLKLFQIFAPFAVRTVMIYWMGVEYLGLSSLFTSVLQVLNLAELGVGAAMAQSMYKPIAENDKERTCAILKLYKVYYRIIGIIIAVIGVTIIPFVPSLIKGEVPKGINIYVLYLLNLSATVVSYWLFAYKNSLLQAHQRSDAVSKVAILTVTIQYGLQILAICYFRNYYMFVVIMLIVQILTNVLIAVLSNIMYPDEQPKGEIEEMDKKEINGKIRDVFTARVGFVVINSADSIVISSFLGLVPLAIYQNYYYILNAVYGLVLVLFSSVTASIGNSLIMENVEKNYNDFKTLSFLSCWIINTCACCFAVMYQPFMRLWVGNDLLLDYSFVILFCSLFYVLVLAMVWATIKDAAGLWHQDRYRPLIGALVNLISNIILVHFIGLYGIIISTIFSYVFVSMPWLLKNLFRYLYKCDIVPYIKRLLLYIIICATSVFVTIEVCGRIHLEGISALIIYCIVAVMVSFSLQFIVCFKMQEFSELKRILNKISKR